MLESLSEIDPKVANEALSKKKGIYFWISKRTKKPVYIGSAAGKAGLKARIRQHLDPNYIEYRSTHHRERDAFQLSCPLRHDDGRIGIDKSSFRKAIGRKKKIGPGMPTVSYILRNLFLKVVYCDSMSKAEILTKEKAFIQEHRPMFNTRDN